MTQKVQTVALHIADIVPDPDQPWKTIAPDGLSGLAHSLLETGQISPIVVRLGAEGKYMIVVGERRWRAARDAGLSHVECIIRYDVDEQRACELQFAENYQREDIPPLDQARGLKAYLETYKVSQSELSRRTGIPQRTISHRLALLTLPASLQARIEAGEIGPYEAERIDALPADQQEAAAEAVSSGRISGRDLEKPIEPRKSPHTGEGMTQEARDPANVPEGSINLSQRLENLDRDIYILAVTYAFNEAAKETNQGARRRPPCPECLKRGDRGHISAIRRKMTFKERIELIEVMDDVEELSEEEKEELLEWVPTHVIEAKCHECGYKESI